jgi:hypothetical protein
MAQFPEHLARRAASELRSGAKLVAGGRTSVDDVRRRDRTGRTITATAAVLGIAGIVAAMTLPSGPWLPLITDNPLSSDRALGGGDQAGADPSPAHVAFAVLAVAAIGDPTLEAHVVGDQRGLESVWDLFGAPTVAPALPDGDGALVVPVASGTCRSADDVVAVTVRDVTATVIFDAGGQIRRQCPGPSGAPRGTLFAISVADEFAASIDKVDVRFGAGSGSSNEGDGSDAQAGGIEAERTAREREVEAELAALERELDHARARRAEAADGTYVDRQLAERVLALETALARLRAEIEASAQWTEHRGVVSRLVDYVAGLPRDGERRSELFPDHVTLDVYPRLDDGVRAASAADLHRRSAWQVDDALNLADFLVRVGQDRVWEVHPEPQPYCAAPPLGAPGGYEDHKLRMVVPGDSYDSCLQWFGIELYLDDTGRIAYVRAQLWER